MPENLFKGGWGFIIAPPEEPDTRFDVEDIGSADQVNVHHANPSGATSVGITTGGVLRFIRVLPGNVEAIYYYGGRIVFQQGDVSTMKGKYRIVPAIQIDLQLKTEPIVRNSDPDWVTNRPA